MWNENKEIKPGDILLVKREEEQRTSCYLIGIYIDGSWVVTCLDDGWIVLITTNKNDIYDCFGKDVEVIPKTIVINQINMKLDGKYKYPIIEDEKQV